MSPAPSELLAPGKSRSEMDAQIIVQNLSEKDIVVDKNFRNLVLPDNSIGKGKKIQTGPFVDLPINSNVLAGLMSSYENVDEYLSLYSQFGASVVHRQDVKELTIKIQDDLLRISTEKTYFNYTDAKYLHAVGAAGLVLPQNVLAEVAKRGILITSQLRYSETGLALPGRMLETYNMPRLKSQEPWKPDVLYPIDLDPNKYESLYYYRERPAEETLLSILDAWLPVGVLVQPTLITTIEVGELV